MHALNWQSVGEEGGKGEDEEGWKGQTASEMSILQRNISLVTHQIQAWGARWNSLIMARRRVDTK